MIKEDLQSSAEIRLHLEELNEAKGYSNNEVLLEKTINTWRVKLEEKLTLESEQLNENG